MSVEATKRRRRRRCQIWSPALMLETKLKSSSKVEHALHQAFSLAPENLGGVGCFSPTRDLTQVAPLAGNSFTH